MIKQRCCVVEKVLVRIGRVTCAANHFFDEVVVDGVVKRVIRRDTLPPPKPKPKPRPSHANLRLLSEADRRMIVADTGMEPEDQDPTPVNSDGEEDFALVGDEAVGANGIDACRRSCRSATAMWRPPRYKLRPRASSVPL